MPTTSVIGSMTITNLGPLTTTFSAPSSCSTALAYSGVNGAYSPHQVQLNYPVGNCDRVVDWSEEHAACLPHGEKFGEIENTAIDERTVAYYSPGLHCPENYLTVGVAVNNGSSHAEVSGLFAPSFTVVSFDWEATTDNYVTYTTDFPEFNFEANQFTSALGSGETLVACCPSDYTADMYAGCYSSFEATELASSSGCYSRFTGSYDPGNVVSDVETVTWDYQGTTTTETTNPFPWPTNFQEAATIVTYTYDESGVPTLDEVNQPSADDSGSWPSYSVSLQAYSVSRHSIGYPSFYSNDPDATLASDDWPEATESYVEPVMGGIALQGVVWLVHNASDLEAVSTTDEGGAEETGGENEEGAAASVHANMWTLVGAMAAVWGIGAVAGAWLVL